METIGARIRQRREALNMTQEELGASLRLNKSSIQRYESGQVQRIKRPILNAIAEALSVDPLWLLGGSNATAMQTPPEYLMGQGKREAASDQKLTAQELALLKLFNSLDVVNQARLLAYAADLKK